MYHSANVRQGPGSIELLRSRAPVVKANALLYAHFERPDLSRSRDYLVDFGLLVVSQGEDELFLRGTGSTPYIYRVTRGESRVAIAKEVDLSQQRVGQIYAESLRKINAVLRADPSFQRLYEPEGGNPHD